MNKKPKTKAVREQIAKVKLRKYGLSRLSPKVRLKAGGIIECDFSVEKSKCSDKEGKFVIKNVPPGKYTLVADHRKLGAQTAEVEVKDSDVTQNFTFDVK